MINYTYDSVPDALYVSLAQGTVDHTVELDDGVVVDVAQDGTALGIDVMVPSRGWSAEQVATQFGLEDSGKEFLQMLAHVGWPRLDTRIPQPEAARSVGVRLEEEAVATA